MVQRSSNLADWLRALSVVGLVLAALVQAARAEGDAAKPQGIAPVSFRNEVMAVLSKAGCNAGTCHGNKNGKGGFKLSLRGEDPLQDYESLTRDLYSRRVNSLHPELSLLLAKPTAQVAHEGGQRFKLSSLEYDLLDRWIAGGAVSDLGTAPRLQRLLVAPKAQVLIGPTATLQLDVRAVFSDGQTRDLRRLAVYTPANALATVSAEGEVRREGDGEVTVLVRYLDLQEPVRIAFVPARPDFRWAEARPHNYIDEQVLAKLRLLRVNPSDLCRDEVFVRRAYLDLLGLLPTAEEARAFLADSRKNKRARLIDQLFERPEYADFWALKWADLLRVEAHSLDRKGVQAFHGWIRQSILENKPIDQFVRELLTARGSTYTSPAANYYRPHRDAISRAKAAAQIFLGTRLQCAECHNHPSDRWTQDDFYDWSGLFARINYKVIQNNREIATDEHEWNGEQIVYLSRSGMVKNPRTGREVRPRFLGQPSPQNSASEEKVSIAQDPLVALAEWLTASDNTWFARVQANRIWAQLFGRGLVDPPDDFRATNPASHPELLEALAQDFASHGFDARHLIRRIMNSRAYQESSDPTETNLGAEANYAYAMVRRIGAEQLLDCESQVTGVPLKFSGFPLGLRAVQLPGVRPESKGSRRSQALDQYLEIFGKPPRLLTTDTERSCECNMSQAFQMLTGPTVNELLAEKENRLSRWLASGLTHRQILEELFWTALTRPPSQAELDRFLAALESASDKRKELEDITWGLLNSKEFLFRR